MADKELCVRILDTKETKGKKRCLRRYLFLAVLNARGLF
jgi:hypothetical protein